MGTIAVAVIVGFGVGILSGALGIGGGTVMVPVFRLGFGMSALQATATSLFTIIPTSLAGCIGHLKNKTCLPMLGLAAGIGGACTSPVGVWLASISPSWAIMLVAACVIGWSAFSMLRRAVHPAKKPAPEQGDRSGSVSEPDTSCGASDDNRMTAPSSEDRPKPPVSSTTLIVGGALIGFLAGVASGYIGVGGGFLMVPLFIGVLHVDMKIASGTSLIAVTLLAIPGAAVQIMAGNVDIAAGIAMAVGSIPGAFVGAHVMRRMPERALRLAFGAVLLFAAVMLAVNEFL